MLRSHYKKNLVTNAADETEAMQNANQIRTGDNFTFTALEPCSDNKKQVRVMIRLFKMQLLHKQKLINLTQMRNVKINRKILSKLHDQ